MPYGKESPWSADSRSGREKPKPLTDEELRLLLKLERIARRTAEQEARYQELREREDATHEDESGEESVEEWVETFDLDELSGHWPTSAAELKRKFPGMEVVELSSGGEGSSSKMLILPNGKLVYYRVFRDYDMDRVECEYVDSARAVEKIEEDMAQSLRRIAELQDGLKGMEEGKKLVMKKAKSRG